MGYMDTPSPIFTKPNGRIDMLDSDELIITPHLNKQLWELRIKKMVQAAKQALLSQWTSPILLAALLGFVIYDRSASNSTSNQAMQKKLDDQYTMLVRLTQHQEDKDKENDKNEEERKRIDRENSVWRETMNVKLALAEKGRN